MGQKKRSPAPRHVTASNGFLPPAAQGFQETTESPAPADTELCPVGPGNACNIEGGLLTNGKPVSNGGGLEVTKGGGGLEVSKICQGDLSSVKNDCEKALVALRRGNSTKALKLIRDACNRYESNALVQRVRGHICMRLASMIEDLTTKQRHLKEAIEAAQKAVFLSPRSVEYAQFHAQLIFEAATDSKDYEEVVQECQRALDIQDPVDPAKESLHEEGQHKLPTAEARVGQVHQELRSLVQKANIASISNWMKTLGNGGSEEKLQFIHMRKLVDDPMEQRVSQPKRPHEVKKSVKTPEERRKDIEVRIAAARLLQRKRDCSPPHSDDGVLVPAKGGAWLERRKLGGSSSRKSSQAHSIGETVERLKPFWNAIGSEERERMLEVPLDALKNQFGSSKMSLSSELLTEALEFAQEKKTWRFWMCCSCGEKFIDCQEHAQHVMHKHVDSLSPNLRRLLPNEVDQDMADQIMDEDCRPFDGSAAMKLLFKSCHASIDQEGAQNNLCSDVSPIGFDCFGDAIALSRESGVDNLGDSIYRKFADAAGDSVTAEPSLSFDKGEEEDQNTDNAYMCDGKCQRPKTVLRIGRDVNRHEFPYADDEERTKLLRKIYKLFSVLIRNKCLASDHMEKIVQYALDELQSFIPDSSVHYEFNHSPIYIRFLPALQLRHIFGFLRELVNACGLDQLSDSGLPTGLQNEDDDVTLDILFLNGDFTALALDERLLKETSGRSIEISLSTGSDNSVKQHTISKQMNPQPISLMIMQEGENISHADLQLLWIYETADYEYQPANWKQFREACAQQGRDILRVLEKEYLSLQSFCERKRECLHYEAAVNMAEALCIEEFKKRELKVDGSFSNHEAALTKRQQELLEGRATGLSSQWKLELEVITSILREAQNINLPPIPHDGGIAVTSVRLSDSDEEDEDAWRVQELVPQVDACIEVAIQRQKERSTSEMNKLDARILRSMDTVQRLEHKLGNACVLDYRSVILPLVKSFLKGQLEDAAEKDALQKSDVAREAFLAELSQGGKTTTERLSDSVRHLKEKSKDKKKHKEQRRSKECKRVSGADLDTQQNSIGDGLVVDIVGENHENDEDGLEWVVVEDSLQVMEEELRRQAEVEDEERKLAETLEFQRRVEEEAKEKHLAEVKKKQAEREAKGVSRILGNIPSTEKDDAFSEINSGLCFDNVLPSSIIKEHAVALLLKETYISDSPLMHNAVLYGSVRSTPCGDDEAAESLASCSLQCTSDLPSEQRSIAFSDTSVNNDGYHENHLTGNLGRAKSDSVVLQEFEKQDLTSSRPKKSGKSRRKKLARSSQEDSNPRKGTEECSAGGGQSLEQAKIPFMSKEIGVWNGSVEGAKLLEAGYIQTSSSSCTWNKHSSDKDEVLLESLGRTAYTSSKTFLQLKAEQDAEERFQADLEQAVRQSLANVADFSPKISQIEPMRNDHLALSENKRNMLEEVGKGLQNESGQYNCFLNVVIQSLWHLRRFRVELLAISSIHHVHMGDPCVVCALRDIFVGLNSPMSDTSKETVAPTTLRIALSNLFSQKDFFQEAQMNDASEVLAVVFDCLHKAFAVNSTVSDGDSDTSIGIGFWECQENAPCIAHSLFALDIAMQMNCTKCGLESRNLKYTTFFHNINASSLRTAKILYQESSLDELLRLVDMNQFLACDVEMGGCGQQNYVHYLLRAAPHVFITVLGWQNNRESLEDISATIDAIAVDMDVGIVYRGLDKGFKHQLVSVICYYGQHYHCFAFNQEVGRWVMFDDTTVKVIGNYEDVMDTCRRGHLQLQVLFYEAFPR